MEQVQATSIYAEEEVEYEMCGMLDAVKETLTSVNASSGKECPSMIIWSSQFYDIKVNFCHFKIPFSGGQGMCTVLFMLINFVQNLDNLPASYDDFKKLGSPFISPTSPTELPDTEMDLTWGMEYILELLVSPAFLYCLNEMYSKISLCITNYICLVNQEHFPHWII